MPSGWARLGRRRLVLDARQTGAAACLIAVPAAVALLIVAPWTARDWLAFGTPLPGQTISNALFIHDYDVFAYPGRSPAWPATWPRDRRRWQAPTWPASPMISSAFY
jgi:hypothetical protein